jgi:flavin reductase
MTLVRNAESPEPRRARAAKPMLHAGEMIEKAIDMRANGSVTDGEFKTVMRQVVSSVAIVTARAGKVRNGLTATAVCSVSAEPPTMLICVNRRATAESIIAESGAFAINFLTQEQHPIARLFSTSKLGADERFGQGKWLSLVTGAPVLDGAVAAFDCRVEECHLSGTHHIYIGRVVAATSLDQHALLYRDGSFRRLAAIV